MRFAHKHIKHAIIHLNNTTSHKHNVTIMEIKYLMKFMETSKLEMCNLCMFLHLADKKC